MPIDSMSPVSIPVEVENALPATDQDRVPVMELFGPVYQGEGPLVGVRTWFVRTGGCDYRCPSCDSLHAVLPELVHAGKTMLSCEDIAGQLIDKMGPACDWVTLSGGNPAVWDLSSLVDILHANGKAVAIETQGSYWRTWIATCDSIVVSPKGPGMGYGTPETMQKLMLFMKKLESFPVGEQVALKIPVLSERDVVWAAQIARIYPHYDMFLSVGNNQPPVPDNPPIARSMLRREILNWAEVVMDIALQYPELKNARIYPQQHVLVYGNARAK